MWYKKPSFIVLTSFCGAMTLSFALSALWEGFSYAGAFFMVFTFAVAMVITYRSYKSIKRSTQEQRYTDAYMYAEEMGDLNLMYRFKYPRRTERQLKSAIRSRFILFFAFFGGMVIGIWLIVYLLS